MKRILKKIIPSFIWERIRNEIDLDKYKQTHINRFLKKRPNATYVELGVYKGECFSFIKAAKKIAVDPAPVGVEALLKPGDMLYTMTSDEFFAKQAEACLGRNRVDAVLVDGLHEFTQTLRDILNMEKYMKNDGVMFIHDCNPPSQNHVDKNDGGVWTGDVWKVAWYLRQYRRDLSFVTLDCDWGVGVLSNFKSTKIPPPPLPENIEQCRLLHYDIFEKNRERVLGLRPAWTARFMLK